MLPRHLLEKIRRGAQSAALLVALSAGAAIASEAVPAGIDAAKAESTPAELTKEQREVVRKTVPNLGAADFAEREKASATLKGLGKPVVPALQEALKEQTDAEIKSRLGALIKAFTQPPPTTVILPDESCKPCGRG